MDNAITILSMLLGSSVISSLVTYYFTRNKVKAETDGINVDTTKKVSELLEKMQAENVDLYKQNTELEKANTDLKHSNENLSIRLEARDKQLEASTKQLDLLRELAKDAPITETLRQQLEGTKQIIDKLQDALLDGQSIIKQKEEAFQELLKTNRNFDPRQKKE